MKQKHILLRILAAMAALAGAAALLFRFQNREETEDGDGEEGMFDDQELVSSASPELVNFGRRTIVHDGLFTGKTLRCSGSSVVLDLSEATMAGDAELSIHSVLSTVMVDAPEGVHVIVLEQGGFSKVQNSAPEGLAGRPTLYITPMSWLSRITVK